MKIITNIHELVGKTIVKATRIDCCEKIGFIFEDQTYAAVEIIEEYGDFELNLVDKLTDYELAGLEVISREDYEAIRKAENDKTQKNMRAREIEELERLKLKYEN